MVAVSEMIEQRSEEWFAARCGKLTASKLSDAIAKTKSGWGASRANYRAELVAQRLTGVCPDGFKSSAMQWGIDNEPLARMAYEFATDNEVQEVGFLDHPRIGMAGASPDGLIGDDGMVEIKCPNTATHIDFILGRAKVPTKYLIQMQWQMACAGRHWVDYVSFDPRLPPELRLKIERIERDDVYIKELEQQAEGFLAEVEADATALKGLIE